MYHTQKSKINIVSVNIVAGCLIGLCVLILSYTHTTALFDRAGYNGVFAHIGVIGFEVTFILGTITVIWSKWIGQKIAGSSRFVFSLGVTVNLYSNITSGIAQDGKPLVFMVIGGVEINEAVLIGALIPILIVCAELVVQDAIFKHRASQQQTTEEIQQELQTNNNHDEVFATKNDSLSETLQTVEVSIDEELTEDNKQDKVIEEVEQTATKTKRTRLTEEMKLAIIEIATNYYNEHEKYPSVRSLAESANVSQHKAKQILDELKESNNESQNDSTIDDMSESISETKIA